VEGKATEVGRPGWVESWFSSLVERSSFHVERIPLSASREWSLANGAIRHISGGFFNVVGIDWTSPEGARLRQPLLEQREIGMLGVLVRDGERGTELLVQAKVEPGNVGVVQLAPTCQATHSNSSRRHGGDVPPFARLFGSGSLELLHRSLQSEQGTRFLDKRNENVLARSREPVPERDTHRWLPADAVLELMGSNYLVNSDLRSVLTCGAWEHLVGRQPFTRHADEFSTDLSVSYRHEGLCADLSELKSALRKRRSEVASPSILALQALEGWHTSDEGVVAENGQPFAVRQIAVTAHGREVPRWDQPIIDSCGEGRVDLLCGRIEGVLHFLLRAQIEPGLIHRVELSPTVVIEPGESLASQPLDVPATAQLRAETWLSDEGGRFFQDCTRYRILDIGTAQPPSVDGYWLSLGQLRDLLREGGWLTNEARSVLALLLDRL